MSTPSVGSAARSGSGIAAAVADVVSGVAAWRIWLLLASNEIRQHYRRSTLGPLWPSLSMGVQAIVTGVVLGYLFKQPTAKYLPYICLSLVVWNCLVNTISEGARTFVAASGVILQVKRPYTCYVLQTMWRNLVVALHTSIAFLIVHLIYIGLPGWSWFAALPGLALLILNVGWISYLLAIAGARFGDVPMIVQNAFTVLFWLTPVVYAQGQLGPEVERWVQLNPLLHVIDIVRAPLLGSVPGVLTWSVAALLALAGWLAVILLLSRTRHRIAYWL